MGYGKKTGMYVQRVGVSLYGVLVYHCTCVCILKKIVSLCRMRCLDAEGKAAWCFQAKCPKPFLPLLTVPLTHTSTHYTQQQAAYVQEVINALGLAKAANTIIGACVYVCMCVCASVVCMQEYYPVRLSCVCCLFVWVRVQYACMYAHVSCSRPPSRPSHSPPPHDTHTHTHTFPPGPPFHTHTN